MIRIRAAAVIVREQKILLVQHQKENEQYFLLPGGGIKFQEQARACVEREVKEETGLEIKAGKLLFTGESISAHEQRHIISLYFECMFSGNEDIGKSQDPRVISAAFFPFSQLKSMTIYPDITDELLYALEHIHEHRPDHLEKKWI